MPAPKGTTLQGRFWAKVAKSDDPDACWLWTACLFHRGYGQIRVNGHNLLAHRVAWELATGETITDSDIVGHTCDNKRCVRNDSVGVYVVNGVEVPRVGHLFKGTSAHNNADMMAKGRQRFPGPNVPARGELSVKAKLTNQTVVAIRQRVAEGEVRSALAKEYDISPGLVNHIAKGVVWRHVGGPITESRPRSKLTDQDVADVRACIARGETCRSIAVRFDVSTSLIYQIATGKQRRQTSHDIS